MLRQMPSNSVDLFLFSPPFANVYTYSASERDMGNVDNLVFAWRKERYALRSKANPKGPQGKK